jgi:hypothetical protein
MTNEPLTQFDYLLNAFEAASQDDAPADVGYAGKRKALFAYVRDLERRAAAQGAEPGTAQWCAKCGEGVTPGMCRRPAPKAGASLTDSQVDRLYANIPPSAQQDARSREAFRRLVRVVESAHGMAATKEPQS